MGVEFQRLRSLAWYWGGDIRKVTEKEFQIIEEMNGFSGAPFNADLGVVWEKKLVIVQNDPPYPDIIHEMGHVFACRNAPEEAKEFDFLGWEYAMAKYIEAPLKQWYICMSDYEVGGGRAFQYLSTKERKELLSERMAHARTTGLLKGDFPMAVR